MELIWFFKTLNKYIASYKWQFILLFTCLIFDAAFDSVFRASLKFIIDAAIVPQNYSLLVLILSLLVVGAILYACIGLLGIFLGARLGILITNNIRHSLFEHLQSLSMEFFGRRSAGDIVNCLIADVQKVENGVITMGLTIVVLELSNFLFSLVFLFLLNWQLALLSLIGLTLCTIAPIKIASLATEVGYKLLQKEGQIASVIEENILSQTVVKIFGLENQMTKNFSTDLNDLKQVYVRATFLSYLVQKVPMIGFVLTQLIVLSIGAVMTYQNIISVGTLASFQVLMLGLNLNILGLTSSLPAFIDGVAGLQRISDILSETPAVQDAADAIDLPHFSSEINFEDVTFSYSQDRGGVKNLSLKIRPGDFAVFVGQSGAGKSTIVNLLTRFYEPDKGRILFDGVDLRHATISSLRSQIGLVSQDVILFNSSVRENIRMGYLEATDEQVEAAAKDAEIHQFILSLPQGYDTFVGDRGGQLSGGQRQRIALARALVRNPAILILDEATSALDPATEAKILTTIEHISKERTVIFITHRIANALLADVTYVMENGSLVVSD
ncbi:ABC transporter ATP-binding protein [Laspinema olomoucense]|uniref:ABC transporter ATP-binding protein n=1 Tax=Laspinema olomoucense TaxID=3231600 RepID=UPI0021BB87F3|nr:MULTISPECIES: ABC transporter ATP-binding protein [unclassified Laspinema]MCT7991885.1 ABC transporter ATP-binding protein/permease [Laspinema sp. D3a]MCT7996047.1 ABC transporter ATP-binding protein/permease [Laspinema sp. D3c]